MHNPFDEIHRASCLRENLTSSSYGEGLETDGATTHVPRQSLTRQIKHDGFRALAYVKNGECRLVSRKGNIYQRFSPLSVQIVASLNAKSAVLDGEIVCLDADGKSHFKSLMYRRGEPYFYAFDILELNGKDLRSIPLIRRKQRLRRAIPNTISPLLYVDHIDQRGLDLFELARREDLEGIVAKLRNGAYDCQRATSWIKIKNPAYTQIVVGRQDLFQKKPATASNPHPRRESNIEAIR